MSTNYLITFARCRQTKSKNVKYEIDEIFLWPEPFSNFQANDVFEGAKTFHQTTSLWLNLSLSRNLIHYERIVQIWFNATTDNKIKKDREMTRTSKFDV